MISLSAYTQIVRSETPRIRYIRMWRFILFNPLLLEWKREILCCPARNQSIHPPFSLFPSSTLYVDIYATLNYLLLNSEVEVVVSVSVAQNCCKEFVDNKLTRFPETKLGLVGIISSINASSRLPRCMVTSPIKREDKADTLKSIEPAAVASNSGCGLPSGHRRQPSNKNPLRVRYRVRSSQSQPIS